jgi:Leucine-rich repeat (LRR) protein
LECLDCSFNNITDLIELEMCHKLKKINLSNNQVEDEDNLTFISNLQNLEEINLENNPIVLTNSYEIWWNNFLGNKLK